MVTERPTPPPKSRGRDPNPQDLFLFLLRIAPVYLQEFCCPVSTLVGRHALRSSSGGKLVVPRVNTSTLQHRAFSVVAPSIWNSPPSQIRLLPKSYTPLLLSSLKLTFSSLIGLGAPPSRFLRGAI